MIPAVFLLLLILAALSEKNKVITLIAAIGVSAVLPDTDSVWLIISGIIPALLLVGFRE